MSQLHKDPAWLTANPITGFALDVIPLGGPDDQGAVIGIVMRAPAFGEHTHKASGTFGERRLLQLDEVPGWIRSVMAAQKDAEAFLVAEYETRKKQTIGQRLVGPDSPLVNPE